MRTAVLTGALALAGTLVASAPASAHGIWGHIHVTGWAMENLPAGELRDFLSEPEVFNAALFGAAYTDSGYWPQGGDLATKSRPYSEHTHWEPFIQDFVVWIRDNDPPPWDSLESRQRIGFLMGCGSHGLQDEIFDSLFLFQVGEHDAGGQEEADPGTDGFMGIDGHIRFVPEPWMPMETLLELYKTLDAAVTEDVIQDSVDIMTFFYVNEAGIEVAEALGEEYEDVIPWTHDHYLNPEIPGSLVAEISPTMGYMQAMFDRLHGRFTHDDLVVHTYPEPPRRLHGRLAASPDSWVSFISGIGMKVETADLSWVDDEGEAVAFSPDGTRWGGLGAWSRVGRLYPTDDLDPGAWYTVGMGPGTELMDGSTYDASWAFDLQAPCDDADDEACPDLGDIPVPVIDGSAPEPVPEAEPEPDTTDAVEDDAETDEPDAGPAAEPDVVARGGACNGSPTHGGLLFTLAALMWLTRRFPRSPISGARC